MSATVEGGEDRRIAIPLILHFDGAVPRDGLDADEVAAVAEGMAKAVQFIAERAGDSERRHVLHLTEVRPGSATFRFLLEVAAAVQSIMPILMEGQFSIRQAGEVFAKVTKLLEFLDGKPPKATVHVEGTNNVAVTNSEGATTIVYAPVYNIAGNAYFQEQIGRTMRPLRKRDRTLAIKEGDDTLLDTSSQRYPALTARPLNDNQPVSTNTIEATLRVRQPHLEGDDSWRFWWGRNTITAKVMDTAFMEKVRSGEEEFRAGDVLRVRLRIEEQQRGKNVTKKHYIDEVMLRERRA